MLTRLRVSGFKNLVDVDVQFGPFTCIAGFNGVGKSNLFDAITFLSALADRPIVDAARCVRDENNRSTEVKSLFLHHSSSFERQMSFEADMIVPSSAQDELGQTANAAITFLRYELVLGYDEQGDQPQSERLVVIKEELRHINRGDAPKKLGFPHSKIWRDSVIKGVRRGGPFISTDETEGIIKLHQDGESGRPRNLRAQTLPRTVLSSTNAIESPTALVAKREMQSWRLLQLEPSALRDSDDFTSPSRIGSDGAHMAATLFRLANTADKSPEAFGDSAAIYARVANRLSELVEDVERVRVDRDDKRELLTLVLTDRNHTRHAARALSDGTLRFLALTILQLDPFAEGLLCLEEPENGIHPGRVEAMLALLQDISVDINYQVGQDNPLRQVIINTHSPSVVGLIRDCDLLLAVPGFANIGGDRITGVDFRWLSGTWRDIAENRKPPLSRGMLRAYLDPLASDVDDQLQASTNGLGDSECRVKDRSDLQPLLPNVEWH